MMAYAKLFQGARSRRPRRELPLDVVVGVQCHTGDVLSVYLIDTDIEKVVEFLSRKHDRPIGKPYRLIVPSRPADDEAAALMGE